MGLREYQRKRDFRRTPEPSGRAAAARSGQARGGRFVVQKHDARRLHYDFRLESDGVLKSWAVPKGPSLDPSERRLAVEVEDHPLEYGSFEGAIPEGEYGGGTVLLWDRGRWYPEGDARAGLRSGKLKFRLAGKKLRGGWTLVRMRGRDQGGKPSWLLIKENDAEARPLDEGDILEERAESVASGLELAEIEAAPRRVWSSNRAAAGRAAPPARARPRRVASPVAPPAGARRGALPRSVEPQLATLVDEVPRGPGWLHELKLDGYRVLAVVRNGRARLFTRRSKDWTDVFPGLAAALAALPVRAAVVDGEATALTADGKSSFQALQQALRGGAPLTYFAFDLLHLDGHDLRPAPLRERKETLRRLLATAGVEVRFSDHVAENGEEFYARACQLGAEGVVSKRAEAPYKSGRGRDWLKIKCSQRQEFVIGGFTDPAGSRAGIGALLVGVYEDSRLRYAGKVGTGFDAATLRELRRRLEPLEVDAPQFADPPRGALARGAHWVRPRLVAEVDFTEWTEDGRLRHPSFQGLRADKPARQVRRERTAGSRPARKPAKARAAAAGEPEVAGVRLSNPDRVLSPEQGLTKLDLARYYEAMAERILPHVAGRPLMVVRCPRGRDKQCFYQKHAQPGLPEAIRSLDIREEGGKREPYVYIQDLEGLISLVQMGVLELHTWGARVDDVERPDRLTLDLDPDPELPWGRVVEAALLVRRRLAELGLEAWVKSTGGKGLHVAVPLRRRQSWNEVKEFARALAEGLARDQPERYLSKASKAARRGKVFIDWLRNARGATAVAAYSTRARPGAPVSAPLRWEELATAKPGEWTVETLPRRLGRQRRDPWQGFLSARQSLSRAARRAMDLE